MNVSFWIGDERLAIGVDVVRNIVIDFPGIYLLSEKNWRIPEAHEWLEQIEEGHADPTH